MTIKDPFDRRLELQKRTPQEIADATIELADTLKLCWAAAQSAFDTQAKPEHALALLPMVMQRADEKHQQLLARFGRNKHGEPLAPPDGQ